MARFSALHFCILHLCEFLWVLEVVSEGIGLGWVRRWPCGVRDFLGVLILGRDGGDIFLGIDNGKCDEKNCFS